MNTNTLISVLLIGIWSKLSWVKCEVSDLQKTNFQDTIDNHLFVFVMFYSWSCRMVEWTDQPGFQNFEEAARIAKENGLTTKFDLKFGKFSLVNIEELNSLASKYGVSGHQSCSDHPQFIIFKYGEPIRYGSTQDRYGLTADLSKYSLSEHQLTTQGMFEFLEKNTNTGIRLIETKEQLEKFMGGMESAVVGYFQVQENSKSRITFWKSAEKKRNFIWADVITKSLNEFTQDTIIVTREFGVKRMTMNKNLNEESIALFVETYGNPFILELTTNNLESEIDQNLLLFVLFYDPKCIMPDYFANGALVAQENGIAAFLGLKFARLNAKQKGSQEMLSKYMVGEIGCGSEHKRMILFRYGKSIPYGAIDFSGMRSSIVDSKLETVKGMFDWLDKFTKPSVKIIQTDYELWRFVEFTEVTILGYFKDPKAIVRFWSIADKHKDHMWADVSNLNPFATDTVIVNQEYGVTRLMMNNTLTVRNIEEFVTKNAKSSSFPVPTRIPRPDMDMEKDSYHREQKVIFIYDGSFFIGDFLQIKLRDSECVDTTTKNWTLGIRSAKTFGQCLKVYDSLKCRQSTQAKTRNPLILDNSNLPVHLDFGRAEFYSQVRSVSSCRYDPTSGSPRNILYKPIILHVVIVALMMHVQITRWV